MNSPWRSLEEVPTLSAVAAEWRQHTGTAFDAFRAGFLQKAERHAKSFPCPHKIGCSHEVRPRGRGYVGVCKDDEGMGCDDIPLTPEDVAVWELNLPRLGRAIAQALKCDAKDVKLGLDRTRQIASLGDPPLPILLTLQHDEDGFTDVVAQLGARLPKGFILIAPTSRFCNAAATELLSKVNAGFFSLEKHIGLLASGKIHSAKSGVELVAHLLADHATRHNGDEQSTSRYIFRQAGSSCDIVLNGGPVFHLNNTDGAKYLDYLLHHPNKTMRAFDLELMVKPEKANVRTENSIQKTVDAQAKREARQELVELEAELEEAEAEDNTVKVDRLRGEIIKVKAVAGSESELGGNAGERARDNVRKAIGKAVSKLRKGGKGEQAFGKHITHFISLGYEVAYNQPEGMNWG